MYTTIALIYWVFVFLVISVFDLKIFREHMTEIFFLSIFGIFAILGGAIVLNVMSNLSKMSAAIAAASPLPVTQQSARLGRWLVLGLLSFALIAAALFAGNQQSAKKKMNMLVGSAEKLVAENQAELLALADYKFTLDYVRKTERALDMMRKIDRNIPEATVIFPDEINGKKLFLGFSGRNYEYDRKDRLEKSSYIYATTRDEREYLERVFSGGESKYRFHAENSKYQLYFPTMVAGKRVVLYFSDYQRYGKYGS
jgi:hypothetical protein